MGQPKIVKISNQLVRCAQKLSISEKRLLMLIVSVVDDENIDSEIVTTAKEYKAVYGLSINNCYNVLKAAQLKLWERSFVMDGKQKRWFITSDHIPQQGQIESRLHPDIKPHIHELKTHYTKYYLRRAKDFKRTYSWILFELLMQMRTTGKLLISLDEFKEILDIPESYSKDFGIIRHKVINVALKEINDTGLSVKLKTEKKGRVVHMLVFTFSPEQQRDWIPKQSDGKPKGITKKYIEQHARPGESYEEARKRLERELKQSKEV